MAYSNTLYLILTHSFLNDKIKEKDSSKGREQLFAVKCQELNNILICLD